MPRKRDPKTTSARPEMIRLVRSGYSSGAYSRSASWMMTRSPVTAVEAATQGGAFAAVARLAQQHEPARLLQLLQDLGRPVCRDVVDDDQLHSHLDGEHAADDFLDRAALVEDGHHHRQQRIGRYEQRGALER